MLDLNLKSIDYCLAVSDLAEVVIDMLRETPPADETKLKLELIKRAARTQIGPLMQDTEQVEKIKEGLVRGEFNLDTDGNLKINE
jgi:hypothetical protein